MPTTDPVKVPIIGDDKVTPATKKATLSLREMGEKISSLGMRMSAAVTLPITLATKSLLSFGANSSKTLSDLNKDIGDAIASQDPNKIKAAWAAWNGIPPAVREAGIAYDRLNQALAPVNAEFDKTKATLLTALVPLVKELTPSIISLAQWVSNLALMFSQLPQGTQGTIITVIALIAAAGPLVVILGQVVNTIGTIQMLLPGLTSGLTGVSAASLAAAGPVLALVAAVGALVYLINSGTAAKAWNTLQQLVGLGLLKTGIISEQQFIAGSQGAGLLQPAPAQNPHMGPPVIDYHPMISTADKSEAERFLATLLPGANRQMGR